MDILVGFGYGNDENEEDFIEKEERVGTLKVKVKAIIMKWVMARVCCHIFIGV